MGACKCRICKKSLSTDDAYCVVTYDKNGKAKKSFYCSEDEFNAEEARKRKAATDKSRAYRLVCDIIGRDEIINTIIWKEWAVWNKVAPDEKIADYLEENREYLVGVISKLDNIEFNRIRYLSTILKNKLGDYKPKVREAKQNFIPAVQEEHCETKFKLKQRAALLDLEEDCYE